MLDALLAEARLRWGLDPAAGLQVVVAERLTATPVEPSRPVLIVPAAALRVEIAPGTDPLPGRHGPGGGDPREVLQRLYPGDHAVGRFGRDDGLTIGALTVDTLSAPVYLAPVAA